MLHSFLLFNLFFISPFQVFLLYCINWHALIQTYELAFELLCFLVLLRSHVNMNALGLQGKIMAFSELCWQTPIRKIYFWGKIVSLQLSKQGHPKKTYGRSGSVIANMLQTAWKIVKDDTWSSDWLAPVKREAQPHERYITLLLTMLLISRSMDLWR